VTIVSPQSEEQSEMTEIMFSLDCVSVCAQQIGQSDSWGTKC